MDIKLNIEVPSFISGMSRILDLGCTLRESSKTFSFKSDYEEMKSDWNNVGQDLNNSITNWKSNVR